MRRHWKFNWSRATKMFLLNLFRKHYLRASIKIMFNRFTFRFTVFVASIAFVSPQLRADPETNKAVVVCLGDSITKRGYPEALEKLLGVRVVNAGVNGNTSRQGL